MDGVGRIVGGVTIRWGEWGQLAVLGGDGSLGRVGTLAVLGDDGSVGLLWSEKLDFAVASRGGLPHSGRSDDGFGGH